MQLSCHLGLQLSCHHCGVALFAVMVPALEGKVPLDANTCVQASAVMSLVLLVYGYGSACAYMVRGQVYLFCGQRSRTELWQHDESAWCLFQFPSWPSQLAVVWKPFPAYLAPFHLQIILGDSFQPMALEVFGEAWWTRRDPIIAAGSTLFMLPLCFPTSLAAISGVCSRQISWLAGAEQGGAGCVACLLLLSLLKSCAMLKPCRVVLCCAPCRRECSDILWPGCGFGRHRVP